MVGHSEKKICNVCQQEKGLAMFNRNKQAKDGRRSTCILCRNKKRREDYEVNPEPVRTVVSDWKKNQGKSKRAQISRRHALKKRYSMTLEKYDGLLASQGGTCALCSATHSKSGRKLTVDHDHNCCPEESCGMCVRGLLCEQCNSMLGQGQDDPDRLLAGAFYLLRNQNVLTLV